MFCSFEWDFRVLIKHNPDELCLYIYIYAIIFRSFPHDLKEPIPPTIRNITKVLALLAALSLKWEQPAPRPGLNY